MNRSVGFTAVLALAGILIGAVPAAAEENTKIIVESGDWITASHQPSQTSPSDVCMVFHTSASFALRFGKTGLEVRITDKSWSLPANVSGTITLAVSDWHQDFTIGDNSDSMVAALIPNDVVTPMFDAMDKGSMLTVKVGKEKPRQLPLTGSTKATNAFRTCAGLGGGAKSGGGNPFN